MADYETFLFRFLRSNMLYTFCSSCGYEIACHIQYMCICNELLNKRIHVNASQIPMFLTSPFTI